MRIVVTGHKGYIGTVLVPMLISEGHDVLGLDNGFFERCNFGNFVSEVPCLKKDLRDLTISDLKGFDAVIHLAGLSNDPLGDLNPELTYAINHTASVRLAELAKRAGVKRFIFSSSCSNYGAAGGYWIDETADLNPVTSYGCSKVLVERDVSRIADDDFSPTFLRCATVYGVSPFLRFDLVLNNLVAWAFCTGRVYLKSDGAAWRPIVHVEDLSCSFIAVLHAPREVSHNQTFNVGRTEDNYRISELAEIVKNIVPESRIEYALDAGADKRNYRVDCGKLSRTLPHLNLKWDAHQGASQLYKAYRQVGLTVEDFEGPRYKRIDHIKHLMESGFLDTALRWQQPNIIPIHAGKPGIDDADRA